MILRAIFWITVVSVLIPHEPDLGLGRPGSQSSIAQSAASWATSALSAPNSMCKDHTAVCVATLGAQDYLALAARFHTIFLEDIPCLTPDKRNEAARFVTLIDTLYEAKAKLVVLAAAEPGELYPQGGGAFEFERTASRLEEMRSVEWLESAGD